MTWPLDAWNCARAAKLTPAQLQANVDTYRSSVVGTANWAWRQVCLAEQSRRDAADPERRIRKDSGS